MKKNYCLFFLLSIGSITGCIERDIYQGGVVDEDGSDNGVESRYIAPFKFDHANIKSYVSGNIIIELAQEVAGVEPCVEIPPLKYGKRHLMMITQDDCLQSAFSTTWAAINNKWLNTTYYTDYGHQCCGDLPPKSFRIGKTLGITNGAGGEIRFAFTTTVAPDFGKMDDATIVKKGFSENYYRFYKKSLVWENVAEILNFGSSIAFHEVNTQPVTPDGIGMQMKVCQEIIKGKLHGRECKVLAEPNGDKNYIEAFKSGVEAVVATAQASAEQIYPLQPVPSLLKMVVHRWFYDNESSETIKQAIRECFEGETNNSAYFHLGLHDSNDNTVRVLEWVNDTYGKDGSDNLWIPSLEEYYEYLYYRSQTTLISSVNQGEICIDFAGVELERSYYPSISILLKGINMESIVGITTSDNIKGFSYGAAGDDILINIDCSQSLYSRAAHYVKRLENGYTSEGYEDALYFVGHLKDGKDKQELMGRIEKSRMDVQ